MSTCIHQSQNLSIHLKMLVDIVKDQDIENRTALNFRKKWKKVILLPIDR